jgi:signal peptidase I
MTLFNGKAIREFILLLVIAGAVYLGMRFTVHTYIVYGPSMQPNFVDNEWIIVDKLSYRFHDPQRGDIIVFKPPFNETKNYIKRIIGLPGEAVEVKGGKTYVYKTDGTTIILDETAYQVEPSAQDFPKRAIPLGQYYVMGDNRNNSNDSRYGWTVPRNEIIGKAWLNIWPPARWGLALNFPLPNGAAEASAK